MSFIGKSILITGGSQGIGKATAEAFAERGASVCINFHKNNRAAKATVEALPGEGHFAVKADIARAESVRQLFESVLDEFGKIDVVVNNAGVYLLHPLAETDFDDWQKAWKETLDLNLTGAANVCWCAARQMIRQGSGGVIVNVSSRGAFRGRPEYPAYAASKAGLNALTQSLALALGRHRISVTAVAPGFVETEMVRDLLDGPEGDAIRRQSPMGRVATPEEVANVIVFLASEGSEFMTGGIVDVNGASYLRM